jgi:tetratricopeptide (TPR) repeat protein
MLRALLFLILSAALVGGYARQSPQNRPGDEGDTQKQADSSEANRLYELAAALFKQGELDDAMASAKRAAELREKVEGRDSASAAQAILLLADIDRLMGHGDQAEPLYRRAISVLEKKPDEQSD